MFKILWQRPVWKTDIKIKYIKSGITIESNGKVSYTISDINGNIIKQGIFQNAKEITLNKNEIYFLNMNIKDKQLNKKTIILK